MIVHNLEILNFKKKEQKEANKNMQEEIPKADPKYAADDIPF
jgi:hypothetical protein